MKKFKLLLLDANIVIELFRLGLWNKILSHCEISLAKTVIDEAEYFEDEIGDLNDIDLTKWINRKEIVVVEQTPSDLASLKNQFDPVYIEKMDPGETESIAFLLKQTAEYKLCSADKIVFRILGNLNRGEQGISLEEILKQIGLNRKLGNAFTEAYRKQWTQRGFQERINGIGHKKL